MGEIENTGRKVFVTVLCYIEDLMLQMLIFNGHDVAGDKRVILDVIQQFFPEKDKRILNARGLFAASTVAVKATAHISYPSRRLGA